jgi:chromosome segregation ATPase
MNDWAELNAQRISLEDQINAAELKLDEQRRLAQPNREQMARLSSIINAGLERLRPVNERLAQMGRLHDRSASTTTASQPGLGSGDDMAPASSSDPV